jgi:aminopeptidase N
LQIWTQGQGKYTSNWFPSFDDVNEKVIFNIELAFSQEYQAISNGILTKKTTNNNMTLWEYRMENP